MERLYAAAIDQKLIDASHRQSQLARLLNVPSQNVKHWETRGPSKNVRLECQARFGINASWVETGEGRAMVAQPNIIVIDEFHHAKIAKQLLPVAVWEHIGELPEDGFIMVPRLNVKLSAGNGRGEQLDIELEREHPQVFRAEWARKERLKAAALASMYASGSSMEPRICDGDSLLVDTSQTTVIDGKVYAIWYAGEMRVKRLYKRVDGGLLVHSDNDRDYPRLEVPAEQMEHVRIVGRIVHVQGTGGL